MRICKVGQPKGLEYAYKVESPRFWDSFRDLTIKDATGERMYFKTPENAFEYLGGKKVGRYLKYSAIEPKVVYVIELSGKPGQLKK